MAIIRTKWGSLSAKSATLEKVHPRRGKKIATIAVEVNTNHNPEKVHAYPAVLVFTLMVQEQFSVKFVGRGNTWIPLVQ